MCVFVLSESWMVADLEEEEEEEEEEERVDCMAVLNLFKDCWDV